VILSEFEHKHCSVCSCDVAVHSPRKLKCIRLYVAPTFTTGTVRKSSSGPTPSTGDDEGELPPQPLYSLERTITTFGKISLLENVIAVHVEDVEELSHDCVQPSALLQRFPFVVSFSESESDSK
jgi:hypothetical protein